MSEAEEKLRAELKLAVAEAKKNAPDLKGWKVLKDPGQIVGPSWPVGLVPFMTFAELHAVFGDAIPYGNSVRKTAKGKDYMTLEWAFLSPDGREWILSLECLKSPALNKEEKVEWSLRGSGTDYDDFAEWLSATLNRRLSVICCDEDERFPARRKFAVSIFGTVPHEHEEVSPDTVKEKAP